MRIHAVLVLSAMTTVGCGAGATSGARDTMARAAPRTDATIAPPPLPPPPCQPPPQIDPVVASMPRSAESTIVTTARYIAEHEPDQRARIKALHDWVADRIAYDASDTAVLVVPLLPDMPRRTLCEFLPEACTTDAFGMAPLFVSSDDFARLTASANGEDALPSFRDYLADRAFVRRRGVCANYAALMTSLGAAIGEEVVYVTGTARTADGELGKHAWNVARIGDHYEPLDVTWDAGFVDGTTFQRRYSNAWLFPSADEFLRSHFPSDARWQLHAPPASLSWFHDAEAARRR